MEIESIFLRHREDHLYDGDGEQTAINVTMMRRFIRFRLSSTNASTVGPSFDAFVEKCRVPRPDVEARIIDSRGLYSAVVYVDGSRQPALADVGQSRAGIGVFWGVGDERNLQLRLAGRKQTSIRAELQAAIVAIYQAISQNLPSLLVRTDSEFVTNVTNLGWIRNWRANDWKRVDGKAIANARDIFEYDVLTRIIKVKFDHLRKADLVDGNIASHQLATNAVEQLEDTVQYKMKHHAELYERVMNKIRDEYPPISDREDEAVLSGNDKQDP